MKKIIFSFSLFLFNSCSQNKLNEENIKRVIIQEKPYPDTITYPIYTNDPVFAKRMLEKGLEEIGIVKISRSKQFFDTSAWIRFTDKGNEYLYTNKDKDRKKGVQNVRIGVKVFDGVLEIKLKDDNNHCIVKYTIIYRDMTPFATLVKKNDGQIDTLTCYMHKIGNEWHLDKKPDVEYLLP